MNVVIGFIIAVMIVFVFRRYVPVRGMSQVRTDQLKDSGSIIVDIRQFHTAHNDPVSRSLNMPLAYIKRHYAKIGKHSIYLVAADKAELNIGAKFLLKKGFKVNGYEIKTGNPSKSAGSERQPVKKVCKEM